MAAAGTTPSDVARWPGDDPSGVKHADHLLGQSVYVTKTVRNPDEFDDGALLALFSAIASRDDVGVTQMLDHTPGLATRPLRVGASREDPRPYFLIPIRHYVYMGDTALHVVAAAHNQGLAETIVAQGAAVRARNRRGAEPLHYAADGHPGADFFDSNAQREMIFFLIDAGADPDAIDKSGVAALHRAVRTRSSAAVSALIDRGADPLLMNKSGSTPLHLAVQNTGKSNSGSQPAKDEQHQIIVLLLRHGASGADLDGKGKSVAAAASSGWIRQLLDKY
jgi:ankyrin repeat protein